MTDLALPAITADVRGVPRRHRAEPLRVAGQGVLASTPVRLLAFAWTFVAMSTNIKAELPYIDWVLAGMLLAILLPNCRPTLTPAHLAFVITIVVAGVAVEHTLHALVWGAKLCAIFLCISCLAQSGALQRAAFGGLVAALLCNAASAGLGFLGVPGACEMVSARGRHATFLNYPGALWRSSIVSLFYWCYIAVHGGSARLLAALFVVAGVVLIWLDGSRTGYIMLACLAVGIGITCATAAGRFAWALLLVACIALASLRGVATEAPNSLSRITSFLEEGGSLGESLERWAPDRLEMIGQAWGMIGQHPILGNGFQTTMVGFNNEAGEFNDVVVHNGYLEVWADFGCVSVLSLTLILWSWLGKARRLAFAVAAADRAYVYNAIFLLFVFGASLMFHPLSTEWSEWITFAVPYAIVMGYAGRVPRNELKMHRGRTSREPRASD